MFNQSGSPSLLCLSLLCFSVSFVLSLTWSLPHALLVKLKTCWRVVCLASLAVEDVEYSYRFGTPIVGNLRIGLGLVSSYGQNWFTSAVVRAMDCDCNYGPDFGFGSQHVGIDYGYGPHYLPFPFPQLQNVLTMFLCCNVPTCV